MRNRIVLGCILITLLSISPLAAMKFMQPTPADVRPIVLRNLPHATASMLVFSVWHTAPLEVAKVFGRSPGCADADNELIEMTAKAAIEANLDPAIAAATVATESTCNQYAVSSRGAIGLMQVMPKIWKEKFDFGGDINLFNRHDNIFTGAKIMASLINEHGTARGIQLYNGAGVDCSTCDGGYSARILALAHK